jgi:hypothetical protein
MEAIKNEMIAVLQKDYGEKGVQVEIDTKQDICFKIFLKKYPHYVTYIREDGGKNQIHCYYIHRKDFADIFNNYARYAEIRSHMEQGIMQLLWSYVGRREDLVGTARAYMKQATHRMWGYRLIGGSRKTSRVQTFAEARQWHENFPAPVIPKGRTLEEESREKLKAFWKRKPLTNLQKQMLVYQAMRLSR